MLLTERAHSVLCVLENTRKNVRDVLESSAHTMPYSCFSCPFLFPVIFVSSFFALPLLFKRSIMARRICEKISYAPPCKRRYANAYKYTLDHEPYQVGILSRSAMKYLKRLVYEQPRREAGPAVGIFSRAGARDDGDAASLMMVLPMESDNDDVNSNDKLAV